MKKTIAALLFLSVATTAQSGQYSNTCMDKTGNMQDAYHCLYEYHEKLQKKLSLSLKRLQKLSEGFAPPVHVDDTQIVKSDVVFQQYVSSQCSFIGSAIMGTGSSHERLDCEIVLTSNRINEIEYLIESHYDY